MQETSSSASDVTYVAPPLLPQQEDAIIHTRITNDEKALRRVTKKFHAYTSVAYTSALPPSPSTSSSVDDAREAFLVELASFHLSLKKSLMVCEAEARQVEEYQKEKERIAAEHALLKSQIEELKSSLEYAQIQRKRKIEYDAIAEKVNTLPSRLELIRSIDSLEEDMAAIRTEHDNQVRTLQAQKTALDSVISDLSLLRIMGKEDSTEDSRSVTPLPEIQIMEEDVEMNGSHSERTREEPGELKEDKEMGEVNEDNDAADDDAESVDEPLSKILNPGAMPFVPLQSRTATPATHSNTRTPPASTPRAPSEDDIEMGEVAEDRDPKRLKVVEDREEGEASDADSPLTAPPDDDDDD
ncbi:hypothetical protein WOLCODRAFT_88952 [Wolfiporia cocos MD-104 SS10]|uniref:Uncharacterized protein n=1 Tax=Wolfiporia cocos (strain MD-104) TaxID=742152 RepID=A0A2H3JFK6_WOLCO|nr:hypothetical protein WOLCODRAFT_88952 [Wolfiporia cocos MD-104 SS10]